MRFLMPPRVLALSESERALIASVARDAQTGQYFTERQLLRLISASKAPIVSAPGELSDRREHYHGSMNAHLPLATTASLIADPARAAIMLALLDGRALSAGELARCAGVSAQSASMHLAQLLQSGFVQVASQGRHRYYRIASPDVAHAVEALGVISSPRKRKPVGESESIRYARTCYDHLAGELGVALADSLERRRLIRPRTEREYALTEDGEGFLRQWSIDLPALRDSRRVLARRCLDWTERRYHLAGAMGAAIFQRMLNLHWIKRDSESRVLHVTVTGKKELDRFLGNSHALNTSGGAETSASVLHSSYVHATNTRRT
jgi:DNA-binding transcriptional ArsR family regulator